MPSLRVASGLPGDLDKLAAHRNDISVELSRFGGEECGRK